jgi:hypothetical protein
MIAPKQPKPLQPMKASELPDDMRQALRAQHRAARKLRAEHRRLGLPIIVWKNGKVVEEQP